MSGELLRVRIDLGRSIVTVVRRGGDAVDRFDLVEPFALDHALLQVEARRRGVAGRPASVVRLDRHRAYFSRSRTYQEQMGRRMLRFGTILVMSPARDPSPGSISRDFSNLLPKLT